MLQYQYMNKYIKIYKHSSYKNNPLQISLQGENLIFQEINNYLLPDSEYGDRGVLDGYRVRHNTHHKAF